MGRTIPAFVVLIAAAATAQAETCRLTAADIRAGRPCPPERRLVPHDPDRAAAGREPGRFRFGEGTDVRIGGRVRTEYEMRR